MSIGSLVRKRNHAGVLGTFYAPRWWGVIVDVNSKGMFDVAFITHNGVVRREILSETQLVLAG